MHRKWTGNAMCIAQSQTMIEMHRVHFCLDNTSVFDRVRQEIARMVETWNIVR